MLTKNIQKINEVQSQLLENNTESRYIVCKTYNPISTISRIEKINYKDIINFSNNINFSYFKLEIFQHEQQTKYKFSEIDDPEQHAYQRIYQEELAKIHEMNILVIDDNDFVLSTIQRLLQQDNYHNIITTNSIKSTYNILEEKDIDLILLDIELPDGDGRIVCQNLKSHYKFSHIPIIIITGLEASEDILNSVLKCHADDFLTKPFEFNAFRIRIKNALRMLITHKLLQKKVMNLQNKLQKSLNLPKEIKVCPCCKSIKSDKIWCKFEEFLQKYPLLAYENKICPKCNNGNSNGYSATRFSSLLV